MKFSSRSYGVTRTGRPLGRSPGHYVGLLLLLVPLLLAAGAGDEKGRVGPAKVAFGPACEKLLRDEIGKARKEIKVAIYSFTRRNISRALTDAVKRGVEVDLKYDVKSSEWPGMRQAIGYMRKRGVTCRPISVAGKYGKMHHKFVVIDGLRVLTGSYNFTTTASTVNYENLVLLEGKGIAAKFLAEFKRIQSSVKGASKKIDPKGAKKK